VAGGGWLLAAGDWRASSSDHRGDGHWVLPATSG